MSLTDMLFQGGPVMLVLLLFSICAVGITLFKLHQLSQLGGIPLSSVEASLREAQGGELEKAAEHLQTCEHPIARVLLASLSRESSPQDVPGQIESEMERVGSNEMRRLESYLGGLAAIAQLSPLLGLLGTVLGMIESFIEIELATTQVSPALLAGGIWEALLTTAFGLTIAILTTAAHQLLFARVDSIRSLMKDLSVQMLFALRSARVHERQVPLARSA